MSYVAAAVVVVGALCLVNLALTFAVIRRMRQYGERIAAAPRVRPVLPRLPAGTLIPEFSVTTVSGERRSIGDLSGERSLVGFFSPGCPPCRTQLPEFIELARTIPGGADQVLAVVVGEGKQAEEFAAGLDSAASVVIEPAQGQVAMAFSAEGYPSFYLIGADGRVEASGAAVQMLANPMPV